MDSPEIAFELNEHSHGYIQYFYAFLKAGRLVEASGMNRCRTSFSQTFGRRHEAD